MRRLPRPRLPRPAAPLARALVVLTGSACVLVSVLPDPARPVLVGAGLAVTAAVAAAATAWRGLGSLALALTTLAVLLASALDASDLRPVQVVAAAVLLMAMVAALDRAELRPVPVIVLRADRARRLGPPALGAAASAVVAYTGARTVVPSVGLVLAGLAAVVAALVLATRAHRNPADDPDVGESLPVGVPTRRPR